MRLRDMLKHYSCIIRQWIRLILLGIIGTAAITWLICLFLPPIYQASSLIKVNGSTTSTTNDVFSNQAQAVGYALLVTDPHVLEAAAREVPGISVGQLSGAVSDAPVDNTEIIAIRAQSNSPQRAADIANAIAHAFVQLQVAKETENIQSAADQLFQAITQIRLSINTAQQKLATLQSARANTDSIALQRSLLDINQATYNSSLITYNQLQVRKLEAATILTIVQPATVPGKASSPQVVLSVLLACGGALLVMIVIALSLDWLDTTIKTSADVSQRTGLEPLGCIPLDSSKKLSTHLLDASIESTNSVREGFMMLGTSLLALLQERQMLLVTGLQPYVGTSTAVAFLAMALANAGVRVLLIDAHLQRPLLHKVFRRFNIRGLTNCLSDVQHFGEPTAASPQFWLTQWQTHIPNLWLLPAGPPATQSSTTRYIAELLELKEWFLGRHQVSSNQIAPALIDIILCDSPALQAGPDTHALASVSDATVLIVEAGKEQPTDLNAASILLQSLEAPLLGIVINRQQTKHRTYFYPDQPTPIPSSTMPPAVVPTRQRSDLKKQVSRAVIPALANTAPGGIAYQDTLELAKAKAGKMQFGPLLQVREAGQQSLRNGRNV